MTMKTMFLTATAIAALLPLSALAQTSDIAPSEKIAAPAAVMTETDAAEAKATAASASTMAPGNTITIGCGTTGQQTNINTGGTNVTWQSTFPGPAINATTLTAPVPVPWWTAAPAIASTARWITRGGTPAAPVAAPSGTYMYRIQIVVQPSCNPAVHKVFIEGRAAGADSAIANLIKTSGPPTPTVALGSTAGYPAIPLPSGALAAHAFTVYQPTVFLTPGTYVMRLTVKHNGLFNGPTPAPQGVVFHGWIMH
jgi:hypothetical protein